MASESVIVGCTRDNKKVYLCGEASNHNILAVGKSGCGKTTELLNLIVQKAKAGEHILVINYRDSTYGLPAALANEYARLASVVDVVNEGLAVPLFTPQKNADGREESEESMLERIVKIFRYAANLAPTQENILLEALRTTYDQNAYASAGMNVAAEFLSVQNKHVAEQTLSKMKLFFSDNFLHDGDFLAFKKNILEINLNDLEYDDQMTVVRFLLDYLLRMAFKGRFRGSGITIFVDEAQDLDFSKNSPVVTLLNETRKQNVRLMFATPSITEAKKKCNETLAQCGLCLYFSPMDSDRRKVAGFIGTNPRSIDHWVYRLSKLGRGEFVAKGNVALDGNISFNPLVLRGYVEDKRKSSSHKVIVTNCAGSGNNSCNAKEKDMQLTIPIEEEDEDE